MALLKALVTIVHSSGLTPDVTNEDRLAVATGIAAVAAAASLEITEATSSLFACVLLIGGLGFSALFGWWSSYRRGKRADNVGELNQVAGRPPNVDTQISE